MREVSTLRGINEIRTPGRACKRPTGRGGAAKYLELHGLAREREWLQVELVKLAKRRKRLEERLVEVRNAMGLLTHQVQGTERAGAHADVILGNGRSGDDEAAGASGSGRWRSMKAPY